MRCQWHRWHRAPGRYNFLRAGEAQEPDRGHWAAESVLANKAGIIIILPVVVTRYQRPLRIVDLYPGSLSGSVTPKAPNDGPRARTTTVALSRSPMMNPLISTLSPVRRYCAADVLQFGVNAGLRDIVNLGQADSLLDWLR